MRIHIVLIAGVMLVNLMMALPVAQAASASAPGAANFPASYQPALKTLQSKYPNWKFVALNTGLDWETVIKNQTNPYPTNKSLVPVSFDAAMKDTSYTGQIEPGWVRASAGAVKYYMDPRNFLDEKNIFQFELLSYDSSTHQLAGVQAILAGTFMTSTSNITYVNTSGTTSTITKSYSQTIMDAGIANKTSPYYLASKIRHEVVLGGGGPSDSVTGKVSGYTGIYNFYNIGATAGANPVVNGLSWAKNSANGYQTPWTDPVKSISGGAAWIARGYINVGQDTIYLQKYNVAPSDSSQIYWHQYMTNIAGAVGEGEKLYNGYAALGLLSQAKVFYIPVYNNMPSTPCYRPSGFTGSEANLYVLNTAGVNIRTGPGTGYASYGTFPEGTTVKVLSFSHTTAGGYTWAQVQLSNGSIGYIANQYLTARTPMTIPATNPVNLKITPSLANSGDTIKVTWNSVEGATKYRIRVYRDGVQDTTLLKDQTSTTFIFTPRSPGTYRIRVYAGNSIGWKEPGTSKNVTVQTPRVPMIDPVNVKISPTPTNIGNTVKVTWNSVEGATKYRVRVYRDGVQDTSLLKDQSTTTYEFKPKSTGVYRIRIYAGNSAGWKEPGASANLTVQQPKVPTSDPVNVKITPSPANTGDSIRVTWNSVSDATKYRIRVYRDGVQETKLMMDQTSTIYTFKPEKPGTYRIRIYAGNPIGWREPGANRNVTVQAPKIPATDPANIVVVPSPAIVGDGVKVTWSAVAGATKYRIRVYRDGVQDTSLMKDVTGTSLTLTFKNPGFYRVRVYAGNPIGWKEPGANVYLTVRLLNAPATAPIQIDEFVIP